MTAAQWVEQAAGWGWIVGTFSLVGCGGVMGYWFRGLVERERDRERDDYEDAVRAARIYQREIEAARRRHPSGR